MNDNDLRIEAWNQSRDKADYKVNGEVWGQVCSQVREQFDDLVDTKVNNHIYIQVQNRARVQLREDLRNKT